MNLKVKLNLNLNSQVHCQFDLKSGIATKSQAFCTLRSKNRRAIFPFRFTFI